MVNLLSIHLSHLYEIGWNLAVAIISIGNTTTYLEAYHFCDNTEAHHNQGHSLLDTSDQDEHQKSVTHGKLVSQAKNKQ